MSTQPELLAHHYTEANCPAPAINYWLKAGMAAVRTSANVEAIDQFGRGLALVEALPDPRERAERELELQMALGSALIATKLYNHPDVGRTYARAWELCRQGARDFIMPGERPESAPCRLSPAKPRSTGFAPQPTFGAAQTSDRLGWIPALQV